MTGPAWFGRAGDRSRAYLVVVKSEDGNKTKKVYRDDPGGDGQEIVKEVSVCPKCAGARSQT